jgi:hypothetical protein
MAKIRLNNFRVSIYIDVDGTVTLTDLPPELREVAAALDPAHQWGAPCAVVSPRDTTPSWRATPRSAASSADAEEHDNGD